MVARLHGDFAFVLHDSRMVSYSAPLSTPCKSPPCCIAGCRLKHANALAAVLIFEMPVQGQTLAACSAGTAGTAPYLQYALTGDNHLVVTGGFQGVQSHGKLSRRQLRLPVTWGPLQVRMHLTSHLYGGQLQRWHCRPMYACCCSCSNALMLTGHMCPKPQTHEVHVCRRFVPITTSMAKMGASSSLHLFQRGLLTGRRYLAQAKLRACCLRSAISA